MRSREEENKELIFLRPCKNILTSIAGPRNKLTKEVKNEKSKKRPSRGIGRQPKCQVNGYVDDITRGV